MALIPRRLYWKLTLLVSLILAFTIIAYGWFTGQKNSEIHLKAIESSARVMANNLAISCANYLITSDYAAMELLLTQSAALPDVRRVQVSDKDGNILTDIVHAPGSVPWPTVIFGSPPIDLPPSPQTSIKIEEDRMVVLQPIVAGSLLGWVRVAYSLDTIRKTQGIILKNSLLVGILGIIISFIALLIVLRPPVNSIKRIADFARRLDERKGDTIPVESSFIELEDLGNALNYASQKLHSTEKAIISEKERFEMLHQIAVELNRTMDIGEILNMILCFPRDVLKAEVSAIALYDDAGKVKKLITRGIETAPDKGLLEDRDILRFMQYSLTPVRISDIRTHPAFSDEFPDSHPEIKNFLGFPLFSSKGKPIGSLCLANKLGGDFTEEDETLLKAIAADAAVVIERGLYIEELERFKRIIDGAFDAITVTEREGDIIYVNQAFETVTGYKRNEVIGKKLDIPGSGFHEIEFYKELWEKISKGSPWKGEFVDRRKDGELFVLSTIIFPVTSPDGSITHVVSIQRDITEEKKLYEQLLRAQKMEAIGILASGIAHDFNNILSSVFGYAELLKTSIPPDDELYRYADIIEKSAIRGADLSKKIMSITRKERLEFKSMNLNSAVRETVELLGSTIPKEIDLDIRLREGLPDIKADYSQISQVILNLAINAKDAMPRGGRLFIATSLVGSENGAANGLKPENGMNFVRLTVEDTGTGISNEYQSKVFDPFFTTKEPGKGTGLGLYIVHSIVTNHGGYINLYSEPGKGTRFNVYFPAHLSAAEWSVEEEVIPDAKGEIVLVIDDEAYICDLYNDVLTKAGYKVFRATDAMAGVSIFKENSGIDLVILDLVMPRLNGREVFQILKGLNPAVKVIFSSGYSEEQSGINRLLESGAKAFMQKPVSQKTLLTTISEVLRQ
ncbi:MAG: PAS domain S-box protein [Nitrospirae bacterium]|nr:PAS domain S-box protein [Nitrospirota bacterium]MCL5421369.1 PAS domain S-box protein [Nitrospirota bacterium]